MAGPRLRFPLTNQNDYKGTITFAAKREIDVSGDLLARAVEAAGTATTTEGTTETTTPVSAEDVAQFQGGNIGSTIDTVFGERRFPTTSGAVTLFLPPQMQFTDGIEYANVDLGAGGALAANAIRSGASATGVVGALVRGSLPDVDSFVESIRGSLGSETASLAALRTVGRVNETASNVISTATGVALNPNRRTALRGVAIRTFVFTFTLIPTTRQEAEAIKNIINFFRGEMYPEDIVIGGVAVGHKFPNKFQISMQYNNRQVAHGILPCFLQNMNTVYNSNNMSFHRDGNFAETTITLTFIEERTLRKQDILGARNNEGTPFGGDF